MTDHNPGASAGPNIGRYFRPLTPADRAQLEDRMAQYRDQLTDQGFQVTLAEGGNGFFAAVLVIDEENGRFGFLEADGSVTWLGGGAGGGAAGIGSLGSAVAQRPTEALKPDVDGLENVDVE